MSESGNWHSHICKVNDALASIFTDLEYYDLAPIDGYPNLAWLFIKLRMPDDRGYSTDEEFDALCKYEDDICEALVGVDNIHYVGRITTQGIRRFWFYTSSEVQLDLILDGVVSKNAEYLYQFGTKLDQDWLQYLDLLYPGPHGMEQIQKRIAEESREAE